MARRVLLSIVALALAAGPASAAPDGCYAKVDAILRSRAQAQSGSSRVIIRTTNAPATALHVDKLGGSLERTIEALGLQIGRLPNAAVCRAAALPSVTSISVDRPIRATAESTSATIGARWIRQQLGLDGRGVGIALIDSGVTAAHDDLDSERVVHFADFVNLRPNAYDDYGHGTHVAGIVAGNGRSSGGARTGIAPAANLIVLKALDGAGFGYTSNVIAALDYAIANREKYNIRVINLSVAAGVYESYTRDPLTLAARRAVDAGIVVVAAAGNLGRSNLGKTQYGGITAPGNAPWVLTVGASNGRGTADRSDDRVAGFSSRGPSAIDRAAKPDLVAPGVGIESITDPSTVLFAAHPDARLWGTVQSVSQPYLSLSGTSMAAPVVAATVALMLEANPSLTPNAVKAILQFTAENHKGLDDRTQGAGFLNARGAVELARAFGESDSRTAISAGRTADPVRWSGRLIWGNQRLAGGTITPRANAWDRGVVWGASTTRSGEAIVWGTLCPPREADCSSAWTIDEDATPEPEPESDAPLSADATAAAPDLVFAGSIADAGDSPIDDILLLLPAVTNGPPDPLPGKTRAPWWIPAEHRGRRTR
jgi:serine protease AprX